MNIPKLTDRSLLDLHTLIAETLAADDKLPANAKRWGVRSFPDWQQQSDEFEAEMRARKIPFSPTKWT